MRRVMCHCAGNKTNWDHQYHLENTWFKNSKSGWHMTVGEGNDDHFKVLMKVWLMKTLLPPTQLVYIQHKMKSRSDSAYREVWCKHKELLHNIYGFTASFLRLLACGCRSKLFFNTAPILKNNLKLMMMLKTQKRSGMLLLVVVSSPLLRQILLLWCFN